MWKSLALLLSVFFATSAVAQPAFVQQFNSRRNSTNPTNALNFPANLTVGNSIICGVHIESGTDTITATTDVSGDTFQIAGSHCVTNSSARTITVWYASGIAGGNLGGVQFTRPGASFLDVICAEYSGVLTAAPLDATNCSTFVDDPTATVTTSKAGDLLFSFIVNFGNTATPPTGYTSRAGNVFNIYYQLADKVGGGIGTENAQWITPTTSEGGAFLAAFKDTTAGGGTPVKKMLTLRAG